jgi:superfamily I DNA/RNA helicase
MQIASEVKLTYTPEQTDILRWIMEGTGHAVVIARAGTGKTFIALKGVALMAPPGDRTTSVMLAQFNADIAMETRAKIAKEGLRADCTTFHAAGWKAMLRAFPKIKLSGTGPKQAGFHKWDRIVEKLDIPKTYQSFAHKAMSIAKQRAFGIAVKMSDPTSWLKIVDDFDLDMLIPAEYLDSGIRQRDDIIKEGLQWGFKALKLSNELLEEVADHDDQIYGPLIRNLKMWENDWLIVDECFVGDTPILIGLDGKSMTIKEMYDSQYSGPIVSFDPVTKKTVIQRVVGAKRTPVGKPLVRIRTRQRGYGKNGVRLAPLTEVVRFGERTLICTESHKVYSQGEWVPAGQLKTGQTVVHESAAPVDRHYQSRYAHTSAGRAALRAKADISRTGASYVPSKSNAFGGQRGGNGTGLSKHERLLLNRLGEGWKSNIIVPCGKGCRGLGLPPHYKLDIANPTLKIAIEIDGHSHRHRADQDMRKTTFLESQGWRVIRLLNREVLQLTDDAINAKIWGCPVDAEVVSVEPWTNRDHEYVYDLSVENTHCYYAHGLLVHNCQDTNPARRLLARKMVKRNGRAMFVGDPKQSIYGFTGADSDAMDLITKEWNAKVLKLTTTFRCPKVAVRLANQFVPDYRAGETNIEGSYVEMSSEDFYKTTAKTLTPETLILCRNTAPLVKAAFKLIAQGIACRVDGKDIGGQISELVNRWKSVKTLRTLRDRLQEYQETQVAKLTKAGKERQAESLTDRVETIFAVIEGLPQGADLDVLKAKIEEMFPKKSKDEANPNIIRLMTLHRSKGLEQKTIVFLGRQELIPSKFAKKPEQIVQEDNLAYVGLTRVKERLIEVRL